MRIQTDRFLILGGCLIIFAETSQGNPAEIVDSWILRMLALSCGQFFQCFRISIFLQRSKTVLKCVPLA